MFGLGMPELLIILVIILIIFGAGKLPEIGKGLGKGIRKNQRMRVGVNLGKCADRHSENVCEKLSSLSVSSGMKCVPSQLKN